MAHRFYGKKTFFKTPGIRSYFTLKMMAYLRTGKPFPYPIVDPQNRPNNNLLHEAVLSHDHAALDRILVADGLEKATYCRILSERSLRNTPLMLAIKLGRWEMFSKMVGKLVSFKPRQDQMEDCFSERDSMGLMLLSYAVLLRAPEEVIRDCLTYTNKYSFYFDGRYDQLLEGVMPSALEESLYEPTERGFIVRADIVKEVPLDKQRGFQIYTMSLKALYDIPLPDQIRVTDEIEDQTDYMVQSVLDKPSQDLPLHQFLRNLMFHLPALCESYGLEAAPHPAGLVRSTQHFAFDVKYNYPLIARVRNERHEARVQKLIESWEAMPMDVEKWVPPSEAELSEKPVGGIDPKGAGSSV